MCSGTVRNLAGKLDYSLSPLPEAWTSQQHNLRRRDALQPPHNTPSYISGTITRRLPIPPSPRNRTPVRHRISNFPITTDIENRLLPIPPSFVRPVLIRRQPMSGIISSVVQILLRERIFAPLRTIGQRRIGEPILRRVVYWLRKSL